MTPRKLPKNWRDASDRLEDHIGLPQPAGDFEDFDLDVPPPPEDPLHSGVVGGGLTSPAFSRFQPPSPVDMTAQDERDILIAAIGSASASSRTRQNALDKLDEQAARNRDRELRSKLTAWRYEVVLSVYAYSGLTGKSLSALIREQDDGGETEGSPFQHWFDAWSEKVPLAIRRESRKTGKLVVWGVDGSMVGLDPLPPGDWRARLDEVNRLDPWTPPKPRHGGMPQAKKRSRRPPDT